MRASSGVACNPFLAALLLERLRGKTMCIEWDGIAPGNGNSNGHVGGIIDYRFVM